MCLQAKQGLARWQCPYTHLPAHQPLPYHIYHFLPKEGCHCQSSRTAFSLEACAHLISRRLRISPKYLAFAGIFPASPAEESWGLSFALAKGDGKPGHLIINWAPDFLCLVSARGHFHLWLGGRQLWVWMDPACAILPPDAPPIPHHL